MMIKIILKISIIALFFFSNVIKAQDFSGQAVYETKIQMKDVSINMGDMPEEMRLKMQENLKKAFEKTFILNFNKFESLYFQEEKLEAPTQGPGINIKMSSPLSGKKYKNVKDKIQIAEEDFFGKEFLIQDSLPNWDWKLESETKKIGNYTCYKAVAIIPVSAESLKEYEEEKKNSTENKTNFLEIKEPKEQVITVWYTPEIPVSQGPDEYWGLPGLILEANDGNKIALCSKIVLNPKEKTEIKKPKKGKKVTKKEFEKINEKQLEKMKDSNGNIEIHISR